MRKASRRHVRTVYLNLIERAIDASRRISASEQLRIVLIQASAFEQFTKGLNCKHNWVEMARALNVAQELTRLNICSDEQSVAVIDAGIEVLHAVQARFQERGSFTLRAGEMNELSQALGMAEIQMTFCSVSEFERAGARVDRRIEGTRTTS